VSHSVSVPVEVLWDKPAARRESPLPAPGTRGNPIVFTGLAMPGAERRLLQALMAEGEFQSLILRTLKDDFLTDPVARRVVEAFRQAGETSEPIDFQRQIAHLTDEERKHLSEVALEENPEPTEKSVERLLKDLEKKYLDRENARIQEEIVRASGSEAEQEALIRQKNENSRRRAELGRR
jgi:hypothetical protein